uniref:C2 domain-containing protein n=1 Tax=Salix viminalis TaxID=40686 RepID=A0A6N2LBP3_SALVM
MEIWTSFMNPKLSTRFSSIVEKQLKQRKLKLIEKIELKEFSFGSCPPSLGLHGTCWSTSGDQRIMNLGFDWDTSDMSILLLAKLAKPLMGTARIVINSLHIKGELLLMPVFDGRAVLYSFVSTPDVRIGVAFGSGGSQSLPATELPGVSSWLVKVFTDTLIKTMVEPHRRCYSLPAVDLRKKAVGGIVYVSVISASNLSRSKLRGSPPRREQSSSLNGSLVENFDDNNLRTFVEVELGQLTRRTAVSPGSSPRWDSTFNMVLHEETGTLRLHLYNCPPNSVKFDFLAKCEIKMKYAADDSTAFWAIGHDSGVIAKHAEFCGKEVEMVVPFEGVTSGELTVKLVVKEWQFSDGSLSLNKFNGSSRKSTYSSSSPLSRTGRKINVAIMEGKDLISSGKCDPYVKLQYGKVLQKTRTAHTSNPFWNQKFEFDEIVDDGCLKIKCYSEEMFGDENIGSARVNLEGLLEGSIRDIWVPLEKVNSGELRLQIDAVRVNDAEGSRGSVSGSFNGWIELILVEAKDLIAADIIGTSDPYVRVQYGGLKKRTKVMYRTLNPQWNQTLEFPDDGSPLELHVKDHNALLPTSNIGDCVVEYQGLPPNQMYEKWIPLQGVKRGEIHVRITRKVPELQTRSSLEADASLTKSHQISNQMKQFLIKFQSLIEDGSLEGLSTALSEMQSLEDIQEEYMVQLETEQMLLLNKIKELGQEVMSSSSSLSRRSSRF